MKFNVFDLLSRARVGEREVGFWWHLLCETYAQEKLPPLNGYAKPMRRAFLYEMQCFKGKPMRHPGKTHPAIQVSLTTIILNTNLNILPICILPFILLLFDFAPNVLSVLWWDPSTIEDVYLSVWSGLDSVCFIIIFPKKASLPVGNYKQSKACLCETYAKPMRNLWENVWNQHELPRGPQRDSRRIRSLLHFFEFPLQFS